MAATMIASVAAIGPSPADAQSSTGQITVLYDAFGKDAAMRKDWGFSALVEVAGKRILFDTGDDRDIFAAKLRRKVLTLLTSISSFCRIATPTIWRD
jgi:7,8-dihydropterin-6-yl-methyl-4-(beta-D-ribofuranosyl)aminobenzene 5'-phosphate synthase